MKRIWIGAGVAAVAGVSLALALQPRLAPAAEPMSAVVMSDVQSAGEAPAAPSAERGAPPALGPQGVPDAAPYGASGEDDNAIGVDPDPSDPLLKPGESTYRQERHMMGAVQVTCTVRSAAGRSFKSVLVIRPGEEDYQDSDPSREAWAQWGCPGA